MMGQKLSQKNDFLNLMAHKDLMREQMLNCPDQKDGADLLKKQAGSSL
jgi:hypothetical protein